MKNTIILILVLVVIYHAFSNIPALKGVLSMLNTSVNKLFTGITEGSA